MFSWCADEGMYGQDEEDLQLQQALAMSIQESTGMQQLSVEAIEVMIILQCWLAAR